MSLAQFAELKSAVPQLPTLDLLAAVQFYMDKLGFTLTNEYPGFAIIQRDEVEIHLWHCDDKFIPQNSSCYLHVKNIDKLYQDITARGAAVQEPLSARPWGVKQFSLLDPSGNAIRFGEPIAK